MTRIGLEFRTQERDPAKPSPATADEGGNSPMSILDTTQITLMRAISGATLRNSVLADNIANADTPGFQPSDVDFHAELAQGLDGPADVTFAPEQLSTGAQRADGNGVDSEAEAAKLAENGLELQALTQVANSRMQIMKMAMGGNG